MDDDVAADPGWGPSWSAGPALVLPQFAIRKARSEPDVVVALRTIWLSFALLVGVVGVLGVVLLFAGRGDATGISPMLATAGVALIGGAALFAQFRTGARSLDCTDPLTLVAAYYKRFLRRCALAAVILPWAILGGLFSVHAFPLVIGLALGGYSLWVMAPTAPRFVADQIALDGAGCEIDLMVALRSRGERGGPGGGTPRPPRPTGGAPAPTRRTGGDGAAKRKRKR